MANPLLQYVERPQQNPLLDFVEKPKAKQVYGPPKPPTWDESLMAALASMYEGVSNIPKRIGGKEESHSMAEYADQLRERQSLGKNIMAGAIEMLPYLNPAHFPMEVGSQIYSTGDPLGVTKELVSGLGEHGKTMTRAAYGSTKAGDILANIFQPGAKGDPEAQEQIRRYPVEFGVSAGMLMTLPVGAARLAGRPFRLPRYKRMSVNSISNKLVEGSWGIPGVDKPINRLVNFHGNNLVPVPMKGSKEFISSAKFGKKVTEWAGETTIEVNIPNDFKMYKGFKDARQGVLGGTKDPGRFLQEIDGALSLKRKRGMPYQAGPTERYVQWRTDDIVLMRNEWDSATNALLKEVYRDVTNTEAAAALRVIEKIDRKSANLDPRILADELGVSERVIAFAQRGRKFFDRMLREVNRARKMRGQNPIPYRKYYAPMELLNESIWGEVIGEVFGTRGIMGSPALPDYFKPSKTFNPREMARKHKLPYDLRKNNLKTLMESYARLSSRDIFNNSIIQNNKAFAGVLRKKGLKNAAAGIENWTAEAFGGVGAKLSSQRMEFPSWVRMGMDRVRMAYARGVFPLNFAWNACIQTSSATLTFARTGAKNSFLGAKDWVFNKNLRRNIDSRVYSYKQKTSTAGAVTRQDVARGMSSRIQPETPRLDNLTESLNYFTNQIEKHLTGWSVSAALRHGKKNGMKGEALWRYASDIGGRTQSMYNIENLPGVLRGDIVKTGAPFQTFKFETYNTIKEFAGKTGTPPSTFHERMGWLLRFTAAATVFNLAGERLIGRKPWGAHSFIPFYDMLLTPMYSAITGKDEHLALKRSQPAPTGMAIDLGKGAVKFIKTGDKRKFRDAAIRYWGVTKLPAGTQVARTINGLEAIANEGYVDSRDKYLFYTETPEDKARALIGGPWMTKPGMEYWDERSTTVIEDIFGKQEEWPSDKEIRRALQQGN